MVARAAALTLVVLLTGCTAPDAGQTRPARPTLTKAEPTKAVKREFVRPRVRKTVILVYHDMVAKRDKDSLWFDCSVAEFEHQLDTMAKKGVTFVSLQEVEDELFGGKQPDGPQVAITFADNYAGFGRYAWIPVRKRGVPVTLFVHTDYVGNQDGRPKMTWKQLAAFTRVPTVKIESQTCSHPEDVTKLDDTRLKHEMTDSAKAVFDHLGVKPAYIAYPNGKYDKRVMDAARSAGYRLGFTEAQRPAEAATDPMGVPRYVHTKWREALRDIGVE
ncbi:MAG: polysaccharide deacetylase family protein [Fimbriimonadaceae bacterium]|nr:polysaccharide deacetylase family protein [Fimbriimonadaceae bacterium]